MMNKGRISYNMTQRSVRKQMKSGSTLLSGFVNYKDCAVQEKTGIVTSVFSGTVQSKNEAKLLFERGTNQLASEHARAAMISAAFVLPKETEESWLQKCMSELRGLCTERCVSFAQGFVTAAEGVTVPVLTLTFTGVRTSDVSYQPQVKDAVIAVGHAGMAGAALIAEKKRAELCSHYAGGFIDSAADFLKKLSVAEYAELLADCYLYPVQEGGVLAALWYLADGLQKGFDIDFRRIPIRQETVEICEYYRLNPYILAGDGMLLAVTSSPEQILHICEKAGYQAELLGYLTGDKAKILRNEDEVRYLDKPAQDSIFEMEIGL